MELTSVQIRAQILEHELSERAISAFCKSIKGLKENQILQRIADYLLSQFGLFYKEQLTEMIKHPGLKQCYAGRVVVVMQTYQLLYQGRVDEVRKRSLDKLSAYADENSEEVVAGAIESCLSCLPLPLPQAEELRLNQNVLVRASFVRTSSRREQTLTALIYEILDTKDFLEITPDILIDLERMLFSGCCMVRKGEFVTWMTVILSWIEEKRPPQNTVQRLTEFTKPQKVIEPPKVEQAVAQPPGPQADALPDALVEVVLDDQPREIELHFNKDDSFQAYVIRETLTSVCLKLHIEIPPSLLGHLAKYLKANDGARKYISYFANSKHLAVLKIRQDESFEAVFVVSTQKFVNFRKRLMDSQEPAHGIHRIKFDPILEWLVFAEAGWRETFDDQLPIQYALASFEMSCEVIQTVDIREAHRLQFFMRLSKLRDTYLFRQFINVIVKEGFFPLTEKFLMRLLATNFEPENYDPALIACRQMARLLKTMRVDSMPESFWIDVCRHVSVAPDLEAKMSRFLDRFQKGEVRDKPAFEYFVIAYFTGALSEKMLDLLPRLERAAECRFSFPETVEMFSKPMNPLGDISEESVVFCCEQLEAVERYRLSNSELGRLFFDFLSVVDGSAITDNILWLSLIEEFTQNPLPKHVVLAWMHYRPHKVVITEEIETTIGKLIGDLFTYREQMVYKYLQRPVIPYSMVHLLHEVMSYLSTQFVMPTEAHRDTHDDFEYALGFVRGQLSFASSPFNAQLFTEAVSWAALNDGYFFFEDSRVQQRMETLCPLDKDQPLAIYRAWSRPQSDNDRLVFELYLIDLRTMRTHGTHQVLDIPWKILNRHREIFDIVHEATVIMGEERADPILVNELHPGFGALLKRYPKLEATWYAFKKTSVTVDNESDAVFEFIEHLKGEDIGVDSDYVEFQIYLFFYPKFTKIWENFETERMRVEERVELPSAAAGKEEQVRAALEPPRISGIRKEEIAEAILKFVFSLKVEFRKCFLSLARALPSNAHELACKGAKNIAYRGNVYPLEDGGLSLLPPLSSFRTPAMLNKFAVCEKYDKQIAELAGTVKTGLAIENQEIPYENGLVRGPIVVSFNPAVQQKDRMPLNRLSLTLHGITHVVQYCNLANARNFDDMLRWHLAILLSKVYGTAP